MLWSLGEIVVTVVQLAAAGALFYGFGRLDYNPNDAPGLGDIADSLRRGKPLPSPWKKVEPSNQGYAALFGLGFIASGALLFFRHQLIGLVNQL